MRCAHLSLSSLPFSIFLGGTFCCLLAVRVCGGSRSQLQDPEALLYLCPAGWDVQVSI